MREIRWIVLHCTGASQKQTVNSILRYWRDVLEWTAPGYHKIIEASGKIHDLQPIEKLSNGVKGKNQYSIHICYIGGVDKDKKPIDNRTSEQICAQINLINVLKTKFPHAQVLGHRDFPGVSKACPSFDVKTWLVSVADQLVFIPQG